MVPRGNALTLSRSGAAPPRLSRQATEEDDPMSWHPMRVPSQNWANATRRFGELERGDPAFGTTRRLCEHVSRRRTAILFTALCRCGSALARSRIQGRGAARDQTGRDPKRRGPRKAWVEGRLLAPFGGHQAHTPPLPRTGFVTCSPISDTGQGGCSGSSWRWRRGPPIWSHPPCWYA